MPPKRARSAPARFFASAVRVVLVTVLLTLLTFAVTLLLAILGVVVVSRLRGVYPDLSLAYRSIGLPAAAAAGSIVFVLAVMLEVRHYRQGRMLERIERASR